MNEYVTTLAQIYNTLLTVSTRGEDTMTMAQCLSTFRDTILKMQKTVQAEKVEPAKGE